jgi:hypothetical protein
MIKIWAKLMTDNKMVKQYVYEREGKFAYSEFLTYLIDICYELDIPTPILLKSHIINYGKFNFTRFLKRDFVELFEYDHLVLENIFV